MSGKDGVRQIIKAFVTVVTLRALTGRLRVIKAALDDLVGLTRWAGDTIWPAQLTDGLITLDIIDEIRDIDLHGGLLSEIVEWDGVSIHHPQIHDPGIQYERPRKEGARDGSVRVCTGRNGSARGSASVLWRAGLCACPETGAVTKGARDGGRTPCDDGALAADHSASGTRRCRAAYLTVWGVPARRTDRMDVHMQMAEAVRQACIVAAL